MLIEPDHNRLEHHAHTSPMNHRQDRCWNPNQEKRTTRSSSKPVKSATHMTQNLFHISYLSDVRVSHRKSQDWGRHRRKNMEIQI
jgi:hypothetical protein